jgi:uncharacterized SAM-binding protein YcdF (DUF218 family)
MSNMTENKLAIVILGSPNDEHGILSSIARERCEKAVQEYRKHPGAKIIPTGGWGAHFNTTDKPHGYYLREYLKAQGIPETDILECAESSSTIEDARLSRKIAERHWIRELLVVTSDFHAERARLIFEREFPEIPTSLSLSQTHLQEEDLLKLKAHEKNSLERL